MWRTLVHVYQRWRCLVFASPRHLNLRLQCTTETRARDMLGVWPAFPIVISDGSRSMSGVDNIIAALEQRDRVCDITLRNFPGSKMDMIVPAMLGPFPALDGIIFGSAHVNWTTVVPDSFLGGSAPQLQRLTLLGVPFPALPTLLSSTRNLVDLQLWGIPRSGYISPGIMVTCLSAMPSLRNIRFHFDSPQSFPNHESRDYPPLARCTFPALYELIFEGLNEYFEDLVARIDTPMIRELEITFFHRHFYDFSQLSLFIGCAKVFKSDHANIELPKGTAELFSMHEHARLLLEISCEMHLRPQYLVQVCSSSLLPFSNVKSLAISGVDQLQHPHLAPTAEDFIWLDLLRPFSAVMVLSIDKNSLTPVADTLKEVVKEGITEILPEIRWLSIGEHLPSGPILRAIEKFATTRGLLTRLDNLHRWVSG